MDRDLWILANVPSTISFLLGFHLVFVGYATPIQTIIRQDKKSSKDGYKSHGNSDVFQFAFP